MAFLSPKIKGLQVSNLGGAKETKNNLSRAKSTDRMLQYNSTRVGDITGVSGISAFSLHKEDESSA